MTNRSQPAPTDALAGVRLEFARWRRVRRRGARIPEPLWRLAVRAAARHGVSKTTLTLGLDYYALKERVEAVAVQDLGAREAGPTFVEMPPMTVSSPAGCVLELVDGQGSRLRVELWNGTSQDIEALARSLWEARA
jgi:hypothetical protein